MYQLWHKHDLVLEVEEGNVIVHQGGGLPFDLRHETPITGGHFTKWLSRRLTTLSRTYMNKLYIQRRVGRSHGDIIIDSGAISPVDLFWVSRPELPHTWESLQIMRDERMETARVSLEGILDETVNPFLERPQDHLSIFATKGAFPKAIYKRHLLKKGENAEYEISSYKLGYKLGFEVAQAEMLPNETVACELFTNEQLSMVHASELLYPFDAPTQKDIYVRSLAYFQGRDEMISQLERLFLFNYLVTNNDLHGENFGFLYDTETFKIIKVAPAYDFNSAYEGWRGVSLYDPDIVQRLPSFICNNRHLIPQLKRTAEFIAPDPYLNDDQKQEVITRANYLISLAESTEA